MRPAETPTPGSETSTPSTAARPVPIKLAPVLDPQFEALLQGIQGEGLARPSALRQRLLARVSRSAQASRAMLTRRFVDAAVARPAAGVAVHTLYEATGTAHRPGEPHRSLLLELAPGARWSMATCDGTLRREWLVIQGRVRLDEFELGAEDFHRQAATAATLTSEGGALVLLREAQAIAGNDDAAARSQRADQAEWADYGPRIQRRVMWQHGGQAAMLYRTLPGAAVPRHAHGHDEECLMLRGEIFLDDVLLRALDYQLAPAGTGHESVSTDTGVLLYAHGDLDLDLLPP